MKILYLSNKRINKDTDLSYLLPLADLNDDLLLINANDSAITFKGNFLLNEQKHIDIIVIDMNSSDGDDEDELNEHVAKWVRPLEKTYSVKNFQFKTIPVILFKKLELWRTYKNSLFDLIVYQNSEKEQRQLAIGKVYDDWLNKIATDLENLRLDTDLNFQNFNKEWLIKHRLHKLTILTEDFVKFPRRLDYLWFGKNFNSLDISLTNLEMLLKKTELNKNLRIEKQFHEYFRTHPGILHTDQFYKHAYEKQLYYNQSKSYIEPDFINFRPVFSLGNPEILEVKNPNQKFSKNDGQLYRNIYKAFTQVSKYQMYFSDKKHHQQIIDRLQAIYENYDYTLLIGRKYDREENQYSLEKHFRSEKKVKITTYDDLIERLEITRQRISKHRLI